ncbi:MAG: ABC transporter substrate-binding protein [Terriglobales bacterium]|jgi:ABC-type transport system substrate-binding protein
MRHTAYRFLAAISFVVVTAGTATAATRPHYGGTLRVMLQSAPDTLSLPANATPADYWDMARTLSLVGDTLVKLDAQGRPQAALAVAWQSDSTARHWQLTLRRGAKFHDGSAASPAAIAQILGALHPGWNVRASADAVSIDIDGEAPMPSLLAELALPRNLLLKRNANGAPIGTGPFLVADWQPGKLLKLAAYEDSWAGRPFVDAVEIEFGKSLRDQAIALELDKADLIESAPQAAGSSERYGAAPSSSSLSMSLSVELLALVFSANSKAQDPRLREALALAIDRKPIQSVLFRGAGEPAGSILPNWMTGYTAVFPVQGNPQRARTVLADSRQPALNLSYDARDPQAQLIAERIALNAREVGITVQVSLSGVEDIRLMRVVLPSPDPATSLDEAARQLGLQPPALATPRSNSSDVDLDGLYHAERSLLDGYAVIPLFHLPVAVTASARVRDWEPGRLGAWSEGESSLADLWLDQRLANQRSADQAPADSRVYGPQPDGPRPEAGSQ